ncbi:MAG: PEPxxWA-CTERM sorting domain-containing protein [Pseudomonadota bacterium]
MKSVLFAAAVLAVASPAMADVTFTDTVMDPANYAVTTYANVGTVVDHATFDASRGDSLITRAFGSYFLLQQETAPRFQFLNSSFVYDPTVDGVIASIDAALEQTVRAALENMPFAIDQTPQMRVLAEQGGVLYEAFVASQNSFAGGGWTIASVTGLVASDFKVFDPANPWAPLTGGGLDFAGGAITFGFELAHRPLGASSGPGAMSAFSEYFAENFVLTVRSAAVVDPGAIPEPATWAMLILGFGCVGSMVRRRRSAFA